MLLLRSNIVRVNAQIARASLNQKFNIARFLSSAPETSKLCYLEKLQGEDKGNTNNTTHNIATNMVQVSLF
jgi:hypothetical protein